MDVAASVSESARCTFPAPISVIASSVLIGNDSRGPSKTPVLKAFVTGSTVKNVMQMETNTNRPGNLYRTSTLFVGMCALLCEGDEDCRAFTWRCDATKPVKGSCHLMEEAPTKQADDCCVSGAKPAGVAK